MTIAEVVKDKVDILPKEKQNQILAIINKMIEDIAISRLSEESLSDWNNQTEDKAWKDYQ